MCMYLVLHSLITCVGLSIHHLGQDTECSRHHQNPSVALYQSHIHFSLPSPFSLTPGDPQSILHFCNFVIVRIV